MLRRMALCAVLLVAMTACGYGGDGSDEPAAPTTTLGGGLEPAPPDVQAVTPTPGMAGVAPRPFEAWELDEDGRTLIIDFWSGVEPCYVLDHVEVEYDDATVTVTLFEGHDPAEEGAACIEIAVLKRVEVALDEPLQGRDVVDGAASGGTAIAPGEAQPVVLYVSNQSFAVDPVDITVAIDGDVVVAEEFFVEGQHNWIEFPLELGGGDHAYEISSARGLATLEGTFTVDGPLWIVVDYWSAAETEDGAAMFTIFVSPEPVGFA